MHRRSINFGRAQRHSAQALLEFALILPVMLILVLGGIDIGRGLVFGVGVQDGARQAARLATTAAVDNTATDKAVIARLITASYPALSGCDATVTAASWSVNHWELRDAASQRCGGGTWNVYISICRPDCPPTTLAPSPHTRDVTTDPATYRKLSDAVATPALAALFSGWPGSPGPPVVLPVSGSQVTVTVIGSVSMFAGFETSWGLRLFPITAQGQAILVGM